MLLPPKLKYILKLITGLALIACLFAVVDIRKTWEALHTVSPGWFALGVAFYFLAHIINSIKLGVLLPQFKTFDLFRFTLIGHYYSLILPGQLVGDAVKSFKMARGHDLAIILSACIFDRLTGQAALLLLTFTALIIESASFGRWLLYAIVILLACLGLFAKLPSMKMFNKLISFLLDRASPDSRSHRLMLGVLRFGNVWTISSRSKSMLILSLLLGGIFQVVSVGVVWILALGMGLDISYAEWAVVVGVMSVVVLLPISIAGLGLREATLVGMLIGLGVPGEIGLAFSFVVLGMYVLGAIVGAILDSTLVRNG